MVTADSYGIDFTGATDVRVALAAAINAQSPGTTFTLHAGGLYLTTGDASQSCIIITAPGVTVDGLGAKIFRNVRRTATGSSGRNEDMIQVDADNVTIRNLNIYGFRKDAYNGNVLTTVAGTPAIVGTGVELNAQNEEVRLPKVGLDMDQSGAIPHPFTNFETPYYFRQVDGLLKFEAVLSDTTHVTSDAVFSIVDDRTDVVIYSQSFTLTGTPTIKTITFDPGTDYLGVPMRITVKKGSATANVITVGSITAYGEVGYRDKDYIAPYGLFTGGNEFSDAIQVNAVTGTLLEDINIEGPDGDGVNLSTIDTNTVVRRVSVRGNGRQAYTLHESINPLIEDCSGREVGRSGLDLEPNSVTDIMTDGVIQRMSFENIRNYTISARHWAKVLDFTISDITSVRSGMGAFYGGGRNLTITDYYHGETYRTESDRIANGNTFGAGDAVFAGINMEVTNFTTQFGFWLPTLTNNYNDGSGTVTYTPDDIHVHAAVVIAPYTSPYVSIEATNSTVDITTGATNAFQTGTGLFVSAVPVLFTPGPVSFTDSSAVYPPGPADTETAFQTDAFDDDTFQQLAAGGGITHTPSVFAPSSVGVTAATPQFVYLTGGEGWDSAEVLWDDPAHVWDEANTGGLIEHHPQVFTPSTVRERVETPLLDAVPVLYTPTVAPKNITAPLIDVPITFFDPQVKLIVFQQDILDASPVLFEFNIQGPVTPDLLDAVPVLFTPTVDPKYVSPGIISHVPTVYDPKVNESIQPPLIDHTPELYPPFVGPVITPGIITHIPFVFTPSLERIIVPLIDATPEIFEPAKVNLPVHTVLRLDDDPSGLIEHEPEVFDPTSIDIAPAQTVFMGIITHTPLVFGPHVILPTRPTILLRARYDPVTVLHARYDPVTLKHAQNSRQGG